MLRIAIIADIHSNLFALQAVIADLERHPVDEVIVAGDLVGRGPQGSAVVARIQETNWPCVRGNHEDYLLGFVHRDVPDRWWIDEEWAASRWMADEISVDAVRFIDSLPFSLASKLDPEIEVFHGSPNSHSEGIGKWIEIERLEAHLAAIEGNVLVCAHTHRPMLYESPRGTIVNVGSVGLPFNGDWRAQYAVLEGSPGHWQVQFRQVEYPRDAFLEHYETSGFLKEGGITAALLRLEVLHARPFLVPFLKWTEHTQQPPTLDSLAPFLASDR